MPVKNRWENYLYFLESMKICKIGLQTLAIEHVQLAKDIKISLSDEEVFWSQITNVIHILKIIGIRACELDELINIVVRRLSNIC